MVQIKIVCLPCATEIYKITETSEIRIDEASTLTLLKNDNIFNHIDSSGAWKGLYTELYRTSGDKTMKIFVEGSAEDVSKLKLATKKIGNKYNITIEGLCEKEEISVQPKRDSVEITDNEMVYEIEQTFAKYRLLFNNIRRLVDFISQNNSLKQSEYELVSIDKDLFEIKRKLTNADNDKISALTVRIVNHVKKIRQYIESIYNDAKQKYFSNSVSKTQLINGNFEKQKAALHAVSRMDMNLTYIDRGVEKISDFLNGMELNPLPKATIKNINGRAGLYLTSSQADIYQQKIHRYAETNVKKYISEISSEIYQCIAEPLQFLIREDNSGIYDELFGRYLAMVLDIVKLVNISENNVDLFNLTVMCYETDGTSESQFAEYIFAEDILNVKKSQYMEFMTNWQKNTITTIKNVVSACKLQAEKEINAINIKERAISRRMLENKRSQENFANQMEDLKKQISHIQEIEKVLEKKLYDTNFSLERRRES